MYSSLYFVIPVSLVLMCDVLMCDICVPRRALPQIAAESKASAPPPAGFQAFCVPIGAKSGARRRAGEMPVPRGRFAASRMSKNANAYIVAMR
jgi:hypothetical protein